MSRDDLTPPPAAAAGPDDDALEPSLRAAAEAYRQQREPLVPSTALDARIRAAAAARVQAMPVAGGTGVDGQRAVSAAVPARHARPGRMAGWGLALAAGIAMCVVLVRPTVPLAPPNAADAPAPAAPPALDHAGQSEASPEALQIPAGAADPAGASAALEPAARMAAPVANAPAAAGGLADVAARSGPPAAPPLAVAPAAGMPPTPLPNSAVPPVAAAPETQVLLESRSRVFEAKVEAPAPVPMAEGPAAAARDRAPRSDAGVPAPAMARGTDPVSTAEAVVPAGLRDEDLPPAVLRELRELRALQREGDPALPARLREFVERHPEHPLARTDPALAALLVR